MSTRCPAGHESSTDDYCDVCGALLDPSRVQAAASRPEAALCPVCATSRSAGDAFCEACGFDFEHGDHASVRTSWQVTISADRDYFDRVSTDDMSFPLDAAPRVHVLGADEVTIGRHSRSQGIAPDIDLRAGIEDPGVSHRHARFVREDDGTYAIVDDGSTNGTTVNDDDTPIAPGAPRRLQPGDRVHVGAWTTLVVDLVIGGEAGS